MNEYTRKYSLNYYGLNTGDVIMLFFFGLFLLLVLYAEVQRLAQEIAQDIIKGIGNG